MANMTSTATTITSNVHAPANVQYNAGASPAHTFMIAPHEPTPR